VPPSIEMWRVLIRLMRSAAGGAAATAVDLVTLQALVAWADWSPRAASIPALIAGGVVMFFAQKYGAFQSNARPSLRELVLFVIVQVGGLALTGLLFEVSLRVLEVAAQHYMVTRLVTANLVWLFYSFPLWHVVFKKPAPADNGLGNSS